MPIISLGCHQEDLAEAGLGSVLVHGNDLLVMRLA